MVNITGAFALGFLTGLFLYQGLAPDARVVVGTGFLGAYTTFSSFSYETVGLLRDDAPVAALVNAFGSVAVGLARGRRRPRARRAALARRGAARRPRARRRADR